MTDKEKRSHFKPDMGISMVTCYDHIYYHGIRNFEVAEAMKMREVYTVSSSQLHVDGGDFPTVNVQSALW
jgi:hypothetical protein